MEEYIQEINANPKWVGTEIDILGGPFKGKYAATKEDWMAPDIHVATYKGWGLQRFLPLYRMKKI
jgi:hypothetical protein